jgi:hypothetical protein
MLKRRKENGTEKEEAGNSEYHLRPPRCVRGGTGSSIEKVLKSLASSPRALEKIKSAIRSNFGFH